jgi:hypothetical protein
MPPIALRYIFLDKNIANSYDDLMNGEVLNVELVGVLRRARGIQIRWLINHVGLKGTTGYQMFRLGLLPKDDQVKKSVLEKLATLFGVDERQLVLRLEAKTA